MGRDQDCRNASGFAGLSPEKTRPNRQWLRWMLLLVLLGIGILAKGYWNATRDPVIRTASLSVKDWPDDEPPLKILLISDIHVAGPDMPPERLRHIVTRLNALKPDMVLIAGDLVSEKGVATHIYTAAEIVEPLSGLKSRLGTVVAIGNHDHWFKSAPLEAELRKHNITVVKNDAIERGPLVLGVVDDIHIGLDDIPATFAAMDKLPPKPRVLLAHSPDVVPDMPSAVAAVFAGHTHCGQIAFPLFGALTYASRYGDRFACGAINDNGQPVFVTAGLGTSVLPLRYGAVPDAWLITLKP
jgi:uncharacterized protein